MIICILKMETKIINYIFYWDGRIRLPCILEKNDIGEVYMLFYNPFETIQRRNAATLKYTGEKANSLWDTEHKEYVSNIYFYKIN